MTKRKNSLSTQAIIQTSLDIIEDNGVDSVSFRNLAKRLDVTPMALYRHFDNKESLLSATLDAFIEKADVLPEDTGLSWEEWLYHVARGMFTALVEEPSWLPYLGTLPLQQTALTVLEACLQVMRRDGFNERQSTQIFFSLLQMIFGACITQQQFSTAPEDVLSEHIDKFPCILEAAETLIGLSQEDQLDISFKILIKGLKAEFLNA